MEGKGKKYTLFGKNFLNITGRHSCILFTVRNLMIFNVNIFRISEIRPKTMLQRQESGSAKLNRLDLKAKNKAAKNGGFAAFNIYFFY
jgi:hypothetical protein